jgi:hypothetical protein
MRTARLFAVLFAAWHVAVALGGVTSIALTCTACDGPLPAGSSVWLSWSATSNDSTVAVWLFPYLWGSEVPPLAASGNQVSRRRGGGHGCGR